MVTEISYRCVGCHKMVVGRMNELGEWSCETCQGRYPASLLKACGDPFEYALCTSWGAVIQFQEAAINGDWVHLTLGVAGGGEIAQPYNWSFNMERGVDIRVSDIRWCCDAPNGS